ncbi:putative regulator of mushroom formation, partial [Schizophyllum commune Tattone D]
MSSPPALPTLAHPHHRSPMDRVPTEVLEDLLLRASAEVSLTLPPSIGRSASPVPPFAALALSWVCRRWKAITLAKAEFWTPPVIEIVLSAYESKYRDPMADPEQDIWDGEAKVKEHLNKHARSVANAVAVLRCYLERSKSTPLPYVKFCCPMNDEARSTWETSVGDIVRVLAPTLPRWKRCLLPPVLANNLARLAQGAQPLLIERVEIGYTMHEFLHVYSDVFAHAPRLRSYEGPIDPGVVLPWSQLTDLTITTFARINDVLAVMRRCPNLVTLGVCACEDERFMPPLRFDIQLPHLRVLRAHITKGPVLSRIFLCLTAPELQEIEVVGKGATEPFAHLQDAAGCVNMHWPKDAFADMLRRSEQCATSSQPECTIRALRLKNLYLPKSHVPALLEQLPHLHELELWKTCYLEKRASEKNGREKRASEKSRHGHGEKNHHVLALDNTILHRMTAGRRSSLTASKGSRRSARKASLPDSTTPALPESTTPALPGSTTPDLLPELRILRLAGAPSINWSLLVDMVKSRTDPPLECLELVLTDEAADLDAETEAWLKENLGEKGFSCRRSFPIKIELWKPKTD